ncbi:hypothetical protein VaNZ11_011275 [Volvox africanus]|uniref:tRNA/rRNA methyltransferase SpoU type domain-containing protein n=1 Tax=Volvox africanus TaxID=51714 RepID=A0ABQ5SC81_9CHLO|nr:hypothetical protein VaNZ11_011275 [Volvox africanus]
MQLVLSLGWSSFVRGPPPRCGQVPAFITKCSVRKKTSWLHESVMELCPAGIHEGARSVVRSTSILFPNCAHPEVDSQPAINEPTLNGSRISSSSSSSADITGSSTATTSSSNSNHSGNESSGTNPGVGSLNQINSSSSSSRDGGGDDSGSSSDTVIILVEPKRGENIGAAARGMKNFGLRELRLVRPSGGEWPNEKARAVAARAVDLIDSAKVYGTLDAALSDLQYVYAASGRPRALDKLAKDVVLLRQVQDALPPAGTRVGVMFGREDNGLYNEELVRANAILTIDTDPTFYSLNLGQAVLIVCYELYKAPRQPGLGAKRERATRREVEGMLDRLLSALEARSFFNQYNRVVLQYAIRGFFDRVNQLSRQDVAAVRQVLKALQRSPLGTQPPSSTPNGGGDIEQQQ